MRSPYNDPAELATAVEARRDYLALEDFADAMAGKIGDARRKGRAGWYDKRVCKNETLSAMLRDHVDKGDPLDVAILAMFIHQRAERIAHRPDFTPRHIELLAMAADAMKKGRMRAEDAELPNEIEQFLKLYLP